MAIDELQFKLYTIIPSSLVEKGQTSTRAVVLYQPYTAQLAWCTKGRPVQELCCTVPTLHSPTSLVEKTKADKIRVGFQPTMEQEISLPVLIYIKFYPY